MGKKTIEDKILKLAKDNPGQLTTLTDFTRYVKAELKSSSTVEALRYHVRKIAEANNIKFQPDLNATVDQDLDRYRVRLSSKETDRLYQALQQKYVGVVDQLEDLLQLEQVEIEAREVPVSAKDLKGTAVPIIQWSDWHVGKRIDAEVMNGLNEYNPEIAKARANKLFENTAKMLELHSKHVEIQTGVLHLGGDAIEGYLREHNLRENYLTPIEEVLFAAELEITGIEYVLSAGYLENLIILMNRGNHPRLTKKVDSDDYRMNYETLVHHMVIKHFREDKRVSFQAPKSDIGYFDILGKTLRYFHGHQVQYGGGIGGLTIPLRKAIMNWDMTQQADENLMSHFHQSYKPLGNAMLNGSLCGYDWYAQSIVKASFQPPLQSMELLVDKRGFRMFTSIDCE